MRHYTRLHIRPTPVAQTPVHMGINIETQDHADRSNLWDYVADSGITVAREFHPEQTFRLAPAAPGTWGPIHTQADFNAWRQRILENPRAASPHGIQWHNYSFDKPLPWLGVPDAIINKLHSIHVRPLHSLGYAPAHFPRPLVKNVSFTGIPTDDMLDWEAAASAYDYYFACIYHYALEMGPPSGPAHADVRYFTMVNEPENRWGWFHLPPDFDHLKNADWWGQLFWDDDPAIMENAGVAYAGRAGGASEGGTVAQTTHARGELARLYIDIISTQYAAIARIARLAMEDVKALLKKSGRTTRLVLAGPTAVMWEQFTRKASQYLDVHTFHYYHPDAEAYPPAYAAVADEAAAAGKPVGISEFNRLSGGLPIEQSLFGVDNSLAVAKVLMTVLALAPAASLPMEFIAFYLLHFPSTHRNYKHLLYGDMNTLDWTGRDTPLQKRTPAWYPTFDELQIRFATPAYAMFRMLTRLIKFGNAPCGPHPILAHGFSNPTSAASQDIYTHLHVLTVQQPDATILTLLNPRPEPARSIEIDLSRLNANYRFAIVRETSKSHRDAVIAQHPLTDHRVTINVAGQSLTQVILTPAPLDQIRSLKLEETTATPGTLASLALHQTTRLRALATLTDDTTLDITHLNALFTSSNPEVLRADQGGLIQRMRHAPDPITLKVTTPDRRATATTTIR